MPSGAATGLAMSHTRNRVRGHWKALHGGGGTCDAPAAMQPMWTPDTHASVQEPARR